MKKNKILLVLSFCFALALSPTVPVFAQDANRSTTTADDDDDDGFDMGWIGLLGLAGLLGLKRNEKDERVRVRTGDSTVR